MQHFTAPEDGFIKLRFDRSSKGNQGPVGLGGLFRDFRVNSCLIYVDHFDYASKNIEEFVVVRKGLLKAIKLGYKNIVVEGDSKQVINTVKKLNHGVKWDKLSHNWRTTILVQEIGKLLQNYDYIITNHVRRDGNRETNFLSYWGCWNRNDPLYLTWPPQSMKGRFNSLEAILEQDKRHNSKSFQILDKTLNQGVRWTKLPSCYLNAKGLRVQTNNHPHARGDRCGGSIHASG